MPPAAAVYVNVRVLPVELAETFDGETVIVPEPSGAYIVMLGSEEMFVSEPPDVEASCVVH
jgi:hypothetical protein